ncbi:hypothetical protein [Clostridium perfringens]|uniref:hypothetical protein n=1 Tax=Clostridium perfringens TaxID=1502 RepID=UPI001E5CB754|nr:hypothetical protein [Clostridium perfringens]WVL78344.1 hypothetical protein LMS42_014795 [Clostridium perfringens]
MLQNNKFDGEINGIAVKDFKLIRDDMNVYEVEKSNDRIGVVNGKIAETDGFLKEYFSKSLGVKFSPGTTGSLSEDNPICKEIEKWADYILASQDVREERKIEKKRGELYGFYVDKTEMKNLTSREDYLDAIVSFANHQNLNENNSISGNEDRIINHFAKTKKGNYKKSKKITSKQYELNKGDYAAEVLNEYQNAIEKIECIIRVIDGLNNIKEDKKSQWVLRITNQFNYVGGGSIEEIEKYILSKYKGRRQILLKIKSSMKYDMEYCVVHLRGIFGENPKNLLQDSTCPNWDKFDWHNPSHIKELLFLIKEFEPQDDVAYLVLDLEMIIEKMKKENKFTRNESLVVDLIRQGYKIKEIKDEVNLSQPRISSIVKNIVKKITNYTLDNWRVEN